MSLSLCYSLVESAGSQGQKHLDLILKSFKYFFQKYVSSWILTHILKFQKHLFESGDEKPNFELIKARNEYVSNDKSPPHCCLNLIILCWLPKETLWILNEIDYNLQNNPWWQTECFWFYHLLKINVSSIKYARISNLIKFISFDLLSKTLFE